MEYSFDIEQAKKYGVDEAVMLKNFIFWCRHNRANGTNQRDGKTWTYNSYAAFTKLFPFWTVDQIRRVIQSLISQKVIVRGKYNLARYDKTSWYAMADETLLGLDEVQSGQENSAMWGNPQMDVGESPDGSGETPRPIPDLKPDEKHRYGSAEGALFDPAPDDGFDAHASSGVASPPEKPQRRSGERRKKTTPHCPTCGGDVSLAVHYDYWYCDHCGKPWPAGKRAREYFDALAGGAR